jgi:ribosome-associated protein
MARRIVDLLADRQAEDIVLLDIRKLSSFADYFVLATADNSRHMRALVDVLEKDLRGDGVRAAHLEGERDSGWVLADYGDVIVHLFSPEEREYYGLEELWQEAKQVVRIQ